MNQKKKIVMVFTLALFPTISLASNINNPVSSSLGDVGITGLLEVILRAVTYVSIPIIVLALIYSGFKFVKSQGDSGGISDAKSTLLYTILGASIILGSNVILSIVKETTTNIWA